MRILVADDDINLCGTLKRGLEENAFAVDCVHNGDDGLYYAAMTPYDLIILDIMMPGKNGFEVCNALRSKKIDTPVLMLTAKEFVILQYLMHHPNAVITRHMIETHAWDYDLDSVSNKDKKH